MRGTRGRCPGVGFAYMRSNAVEATVNPIAVPGGDRGVPAKTTVRSQAPVRGRRARNTRMKSTSVRLPSTARQTAQGLVPSCCGQSRQAGVITVPAAAGAIPAELIGPA